MFKRSAFLALLTVFLPWAVHAQHITEEAFTCLCGYYPLSSDESPEARAADLYASCSAMGASVTPQASSRFVTVFQQGASALANEYGTARQTECLAVSAETTSKLQGL